MDNTALTWVTSTYSSGNGCIEVAAGDHVLVRDTKNRAGAVLRFTPVAWRRFADRIKRSLGPDLPIM